MDSSRKRQVYNTILNRVLTGEYPPGFSLNRRTVAEELGLSITPVNEAFAVLQAEGIVETVPRKGSFIARLDWRDLQEILTVRTALEAEAARVYCGEILERQKDRFLELAAQVDGADPGSLEFILADVSFHRSLVELSENRLLLSLFDGVMAKSLLLVGAAIHQSGPPEDSNSHRDIVDDLCRARPDGVYDLLKDFILTGKSEMQFRSFMGSISNTGDRGALASVISEMRKERKGQ
jgi:DNA-binding GntR family transcriptional regulator